MMLTFEGGQEGERWLSGGGAMQQCSRLRIRLQVDVQADNDNGSVFSVEYDTFRVQVEITFW